MSTHPVTTDGLTDRDVEHLRATVGIAVRSRDGGNHPFGALLAGPDGGVLLEAENSVVTGRDATGHAETNLVRAASAAYDAEFLSPAPCTPVPNRVRCARVPSTGVASGAWSTPWARINCWN
ncbi:cytidine/deoxycytidylate deaminase family protein [Nocardia thraciensis]